MFNIKNFVIFCFFAIVIPAPWFVFSFMHTDNFIYPYFSKIPVDSGSILSFPNISHIFNDIYNLEGIEVF